MSSRSKNAKSVAPVRFAEDVDEDFTATPDGEDKYVNAPNAKVDTILR